MPLPQLFLNPQADRRIKKGHLWVFSNEVDVQRSPLKNLQPGDLVTVHSAQGHPLGTAFINPKALICGRLLSRHTDFPINQAFFARAIKRALHLRETCFDQPYYRLVYGDSDGLPGLVVDRFGDYLVVQMSVAGLDKLQDGVLAALQQVIVPKGIILRNNHSARELEGLPEEVRLIGEIPDRLPVVENGVRFEVLATEGQKTGWFYDHRINRQLLANWVRGKRVLDVFCYAGGWGIQAVAGGASAAVCVDASASAIAQVQANAALNQFTEKVSTIKGKAVDVLKQLLADGEKFDVVVLDPPAFIKKRKDQKAGEAAYRHLNELAIRLLGKEGLLVSASCSMPLTNEILMDIVRGAARHNDRHAQLLFTGGQGPDHPVHPAIPETHYLKAQFYRIYSD